jgi:heat shock protein 1/8
LDKRQIQEICLIGGSTITPKIQSLLSNFFNGKKLNNSINPDESVAVGAAVQGGILMGVKNKANLVLVDVIPLSLGIETAGEIMTVLIPRNSKIPTEKEETFSTYADNQEKVVIKVYEGERTRTRDNNLLGSFELSGIPPAPRGTPQIKIKYSVDENGILNVSATETTSGKTSKITITNEKGRLSPEQIKRMVEEAKLHEEEDKLAKEKIESRNNTLSYIHILKKTLQDEKLVGKVSDEDKKIVENACNETSSWLDRCQNASKEELEEKHKELQKAVEPIMSKLYSHGNGPSGEMPSFNPSQSSASEPSTGPSTGPKIEEVD